MIRQHKTMHRRIKLTRGLAAALGGGLCLFFIAFFAVRLAGFVGAPPLEIVSPPDGVLLHKPYVVVSGRGERESRLTLNGREITMDEAGNFDEEMELLTGVNTLEFYLENRFGAVTREVRDVVVE